MNSDIAINGRFLTQRITGVQRHAIETVRALDALLGAMPASERPDVELLVPPGAHWTHGALAVIRERTAGIGGGHLWEQSQLPWLSRGRTLLNLCNTWPLLARRVLVTVHDAGVYVLPGGYTRTFVRVYRLLFGALRLRRDVTVMTDSHFSATELARCIGLPRSRFHVVQCGADHWHRVMPDDSAPRRLGLAPNSYVLGVASENPNKNLQRLVEAFGQAFGAAPGAPRLVLVGGGNARVFAEEARPDPPWIVRAGPVSDAELAGLYRAACCFAFPSLYEGFGLPPLEAMQFDCPVLSSREASLPEVCGEAALYCDGRDVGDIARGLDLLVRDTSLRNQLIAAGQARVGVFRWRDTAGKIMRLLERHSA